MSLLAPVLAPCPQCGEVASDQQSVPGQLRGQVAGAGACVVTTLHTGIAVGRVRLSGPRPVPAPWGVSPCWVHPMACSARRSLAPGGSAEQC